MKHNRKPLRQGDVILIPISAAPAAGTLAKVKRDNGRVILAYGEVTGHAHAILDRDVELFDVQDWEDRLLVVHPSTTDTRPAGGAPLVHEEHHTVEVPEGVYRQRIQREYTPQAVRKVAD